MALGKGIPVINGFDLNSKLPLDSRAVADTMEEMNALVTDGSVTDGQLCYCKADKKLYVLKDGKWEEVGGGGGASVSPTLNLMDFSGDSPVARTSITEEEYNNYLNNLYNSVYFIDITLGDTAEISTFFPELIVNDIEGFIIYKVSMNDETSALTPTHLVNYRLNIGEKDAISGNYPITIEKGDELPLGSGSGSSDSSDSMHVIVKKSENDKITLTEAEFDNLAKGNYELAVTAGSELFVYDEKSVAKDSSTGNVSSISFSCTAVRGTGQLILMSTFGVEFNRNNLVSDIVTSTSLMTKSKLFNKKVMTYGSYLPENILPCTTSDNGKVLSVVNGEAQWASIGGSGSISVTFED